MTIDFYQLINFDAYDCHVLSEGFRNNKNVFMFLSSYIPEAHVCLYWDILINTCNLGFVPSQEQKDVFGSVAEAEVSRIRVSSRKLECGCEPSEHESALTKIIKKLSLKGNV